MNSKKEDFLNKLQFELGDRWSEQETSKITSIDQLADYILEKHQANPWHFLRFLPYLSQSQKFISNLKDKSIDHHCNLNDLTEKEKLAFLSFTKKEFGDLLAFKRPYILHTIVFIFPLLAILSPLLISTYLITTKDYPGWIYLSGLIGLLLTIGLFKITESFKNQFHPASLLEYSKAFYVINNQKLTQEPTKEQLIDFICESAKTVYKTIFTANSNIRET